jgi:hypothetical protein
MRGVNDKNFFNQWHMLHRSTCPGYEQTRWRVGEVDWKKDRHSFSGSDYSVTLEVHCLHCKPLKGAGWKLLVMVEYWWNDKRESLRSMSWARVVEGNQKSILNWIVRQRPPNVNADNAHRSTFEVESPAK